MNPRKICCLICLVVCATVPTTESVLAGDVPPLSIVSEGPETAEGSERFVLRSSKLGHDLVVTVTEPAKALGPVRQTASRKLPAVYALDGGYGLAGPLARTMSSIGAMSPAYVVAIAQLNADEDRSQDLLFRPVNENGRTVGGGGAQFLAFLTDELQPFLEQRYALDPSQRILFGHSFGGLFAARVLADRPDAFAGYIVASPSVARDPDVVERLAKVATPGRKRVFVAAGENETSETVRGATRIAEALRTAQPSIVVEHRIFAHGNHISYYHQLAAEAFAWMLPPASVKVAADAVALPARDLELLAGEYLAADGRIVTTTLESGKLFLQMTGFPGRTEILAESPSKFFVAGFDVEVAFELAANGSATGLVARVNGAELHASRK